MPLNIIKDVLRANVPEVSTTDLCHQLEHLNFKIINGMPKLTDETTQSSPQFLDPFYAISNMLIPAIESALYTFYKEYIISFSRQVYFACFELAKWRVLPNKLFVNKQRAKLIGNIFLGLEVIFCENLNEEFVTAFQYGRAIMLQKLSDSIHNQTTNSA